MKEIEIMDLRIKRKQLDTELNGLIYGSIEIREKNNKRYIYVHYREQGLSKSKFVGEFAEELYNLIVKNSIKAKQIKKEIKAIDKKLEQLGFKEQKLDEKVALNIDFARRNLVDTIYKQAVLEGIATTFADTETIIEGGRVKNMAVDDVMKVVNLKHAWEFVLNESVLTSATNFALLCEINRLIEEGFYYNAGTVRSTPVSIGGTSWKPSLPIEADVKEELDDIIQSDCDIVDKAIELVLYVMKKQIFIDGNKRTAIIFANHLLISKAKGLIVIPNEKIELYKELLIKYYEGRDDLSIKKFLKEVCYTKL